MAKRRTPSLKNNFELGELSPRYADNPQAIELGAKTLLNTRIRQEGGVDRRPGTKRLYRLPGKSNLHRYFPTDDDKLLVALTNARLVSVNLDGTFDAQIASLPWDTGALTGFEVRDLKIAQRDDTLFIVGHRDMKPQLAVRTGGSWAVSDFAFGTGLGGAIQQPYHRFAAKGVTIQPSGSSGSITVTASAPVFNSGMVGSRIRYIGREIEITAYTSTTQVTGTVRQQFFPTQLLALGAGEGTGFSVGDTVIGDTSGVESIVVAKAGDNITVSNRNSFAAYEVGEIVVSPLGRGTIATVTPNAYVTFATTEWDEQAFSDYRGWPTAVGFHGNRLWFNHPSLPSRIYGSAIDDPFNFDPGDATDGDAIHEHLGDEEPRQILRFVSSDNLLILCDTKNYYIPQSRNLPITPTTVSFVSLSGAGSTDCVPAISDEGVLYVEEGGKRVMLALATGDDQKSWRTVPLSDPSAHLIDNPVELEIGYGSGVDTERYLYVVNADGTLAVLFLKYDEQTRAPAAMGWTPWKTRAGDTFESIVSVEGEVYLVGKRAQNSTTNRYIERIDPSFLLDSAIRYGDSVYSSTGAVASPYDSDVIDVVQSNFWIGTSTANAGIAAVAGAEMGLDFEVDIEPFTPPKSGSRTDRARRIVQAVISVRETGLYEVNGETISALRDGDDFTQPPPLRTEDRHFRFLGRSTRPTVRLRQMKASPLSVLSIDIHTAN